jgi:hypothetical protein
VSEADLRMAGISLVDSECDGADSWITENLIRYGISLGIVSCALYSGNLVEGKVSSRVSVFILSNSLNIAWSHSTWGDQRSAIINVSLVSSNVYWSTEGDTVGSRDVGGSGVLKASDIEDSHVVVEVAIQSLQVSADFLYLSLDLSRGVVIASRGAG